jgi:ATP-binding cassette subfamily B multidrug efflux pump
MGALKKRRKEMHMFRIARFLKDFKLQVIFGPAFKLVEAVFELIVPLVMARIIDIGVKNGDIGYIWRMGGVMVLLGLVGLGSSLTCQYLAARASQGFGTVVRNALYAHINTLSHREIDRLGAASLVTRMTNDVNQLQLAVAMLIRLVVRAPFLAVGATVMAMSLSLRLSLIFLAAFAVIALILYGVMGRSVPFFRRIQKRLDRVAAITRENLSGARVVRAFSRQEWEKKRFDRASDDLMEDSVRVGRLSALLNPVTSVAVNTAIILLLWFGGRQVSLGTLSQGEIIALVNYMTQVMLALIVVANLVVIFTKASACAARVNEVFDTLPSVAEPVRPVLDVPPREECLRFDKVGFSYSGEEEHLSDIRFSLKRGESLGIIGGTGSGKSTLVNLIPRFYDVTCGRVLVDGVDVREYPLAGLREKIGMVPQQAVLFSGTIRENLRWRKADASEEEMWQALALAQAEDFVRARPEGLDAPVSQGGRNFSGGQRQRLTIARALVGMPEIAVLDDSASALDYATDAALRRALFERAGDMTVILVSQRAATVRYCDKILVLDDGKCVGLGSHDALLESCPVYEEICASQLASQEVAP